MPGPPSEPITDLIAVPAEANDHRQLIERPLAHGELLRPAGRRTMLAILVRSCPHCGHAHDGAYLVVPVALVVAA